MSAIGVPLCGPDDLWLTKGRDFAWVFECADETGDVVNFPPGQLCFGVRHRADTVSVPALPSSAGLAGQWAADDTNFYVYGASGWRRAALQTWSTANKVDPGDEAVDE